MARQDREQANPQAVGRSELSAEAASAPSLESTLESTGVGTWDWHIPSDQLSFNRRWAEIVGFTLEELAPLGAKAWSELCHPGDLSRFNHTVESCLEGSGYYECEVRMRHRAGHWVWILDSGKVLERDADGKALRMMGTHLDITDKKHSEQMLERQTQLFEVMSDQGRIGAWSYDIESGQVYWSSMTRKIHEVSDSFIPEVESGINFYKEGESRDTISRVVAEGINQGKSWNVELILVTAKGREIWVAATGSAEFEGGKCVRLYGSFQDIDKRKRSEQALIEAKEQAEQAAQAKSEFLAMMSHEIRTPLNGVLGMLSLLQRSNLDDEQVRKAQIARNSAESLLQIINDILDFTKVDAGHLDLANQDFNLHALLDDMSEGMALRAQEKQLELVVDQCEVDNGWVHGDEGRLRQVLVNLVGNAIKFTEKGEILVRACLVKYGQSRQLELDVCDSGIGIDEAQLEYLFEPFTQADSSVTRNYGGTGLGLAISHKLCALMGGSLSVRSRLQEGSTFTVSIELGQAQTPIETDPIDLQFCDVLIIVSNTAQRSMLERQFGLWGARVTAADSYELAIKLATSMGRDQPYALVLVEGQLNDGSAEAFAYKFHSVTHLKASPLVLLNPMNDRFIGDQLENLGYRLQLPKPITRSDLLLALNLIELAPADVPEIKSESGYQENILLVEDNMVNQEVALMMLEDMEKSATVAKHGAEAIALMKAADEQSPFTLVLMDCQMPVLDGYEATKAIRQGEAGDRYRRVPILAMTANAMKGDKEKCLNAGMDDYLAKPFDEEDLTQLLGRWAKGLA
ncbi:ATP-binding protein [Agaribacterium sp. ZY112]|uniref:ATP-binding protein n=1 Tax=Agaribacterium sp. ZY112 TaxID=3233574 RepID=UPI0035257E39